MFQLLNFIVFLGAFLLFTIELIVANALLPGFGGSYLVWSSCMMFFQGLLLLGYLYAVIYQRRFSLHRFFIVHVLLIFTPILLFPISIERFQNPTYSMPMIVEIIVLLAGTIGLSFWILTSTSVILQQFLATSPMIRSRNPYVLYATSNLGSVTALAAYPFLITPLFPLQSQIGLWQAGYVLFALLHLILVIYSRRLAKNRPLPTGQPHPETALKIRQILKWLLLSAAASAMLLSVTNTITLDIAAIPLFWIVPLIIYLFSFILTFKHKIWYPVWLRERFSMAIIIAVFLYLLMLQSYRLPVLVLFILHPAILFVICVTCNGELILSKPQSVHQLTAFYIIIALGSFLGSILVSWVIPLISTSLIEYPLSLTLAAIAGNPSLPRRPDYRRLIIVLLVFITVLILWPVMIAVSHTGKGNLYAIIFGLVIAIVLYTLRQLKTAFSTALVLTLIFSLFIDRFNIGQHLVHKHRNFYGIYKIMDDKGKRLLQHGTTLHGAQYMDPARRHEALTYYHISTPAGECLTRLADQIDDVALVGLGAGSLLTYIRPHQRIDIFELDPYNETVARDYFYFMNACQGELRLFTGDARLKLREITDRKYSVVIIDAFNSDAIPVHLLTCEAISEYQQKLKPDGIILMHISNKYLDLRPVLLAAAEAGNFQALDKRNLLNIHPDAEACEWVILTTGKLSADSLAVQLGWIDLRRLNLPKIRRWTDQYTNILAVLKY